MPVYADFTLLKYNGNFMRKDLGIINIFIEIEKLKFRLYSVQKLIQFYCFVNIARYIHIHPMNSVVEIGFLISFKRT